MPVEIKKPQLPNLQQRPQHPSNQQPTADRPPQPIPAGPLARIAEQRHETEGEIANQASLAQQSAIARVQSLAKSAHTSAEQLGYQKALIIASYEGMVDEYALQFLDKFEGLETRAQSGFTSNIDFDAWVEELTHLSLTPLAPTSGVLPEGK